MRKRLISLFLSLCLILSFCVSVYAQEKTDTVRIAFIDSGISTKHIDSASIAEGYNYVFEKNNTQDRLGHGTMTAGIVLGSEELGLDGLCPSAILVPLVCSDAYRSGVTKSKGVAGVVAAIYDAVDKYDCQIINISLGFTKDYPELKKAVKYATDHGVIITAAVGNSGSSKNPPTYYPAAYDCVIAVGSSDGDERAYFSQTGYVDILAPGVRLETASNKGRAESVYATGTSYSCAYVTGVLAALMKDNPDLNADEISELLFDSATDIGVKGFDKESGWGIVE